MRFHLHTLKARGAERGQPITWRDIASGTGIRMAVLLKIAKGEPRTIRPEYLDALCSYFGVGAGELMTPDEVELPLRMNLRPDRKGKKIGER